MKIAMSARIGATALHVQGTRVVSIDGNLRFCRLAKAMNHCAACTCCIIALQAVPATSCGALRASCAVLCSTCCSVASAFDVSVGLPCCLQHQQVPASRPLLQQVANPHMPTAPVPSVHTRKEGHVTL
jgi:hypothetical protein